MLTDYHIHTPLCHHAEGAPREYVLAARERGLAEIGFSDHNPMPTQFDEWRMAPEDFQTYFAMIDEVKREFPDYPIRLGLECDYLKGYESHIDSLAGAAEWDYLIGSVHYVTEDWDVDNPRHMKKWKDYPVEEVWALYFEAYTRMAQTRSFDFLAHPDLVKIFGIRPEGDLSRYYKDTLDAIADHGIALEVSTAGLRKEVKEIYPSRQFLEMAYARHIPIVLNSDSHKPEQVAYAFDRGLALIKEVGYNQLSRFNKRQRTSFRID